MPTHIRRIALTCFSFWFAAGLVNLQQLCSQETADAIQVQAEVTEAPDELTPQALAPVLAQSEPTQPLVPPQTVLPATTASSSTASVTPPAVEATNAARPPVTRVEVQARAKQIAEDAAIAEELKSECAKRFQSALDWLTMADEATGKAKQYEAEADQAPQQIQAAKEAVAQAIAEQPIMVPPDATLAQLEQLRTQAEVDANEAKNQVNRREEEITRRGDRKAELTRLTEETRQRLTEAEKQVLAGGATSDAPELAAARRTELDARIQSLQAQLTLYRAELRRSEARTELLPLLRDNERRQSNIRDKQLAAWQQLVAQRRKEESEQQAIAARKQVQVTIPALREIAEQTSQLAEARRNLSELLTKRSAEAQDTGNQLRNLKNRFDQAREKVSKGGQSTTVGLLLRKLREQIPSVRQYELLLRNITTELPSVDLSQMEYHEQRADLSDLESQVQQITLTLSVVPTAPFPVSMETAVRELLVAKRDVLDELLREQERYLGTLAQLAMDYEELITETRAINQYIDEHVLWIRSAERIGIADFLAARDALLSLAHPHSWYDAVRSAGLDTLRRPVRAACVGLVLLLTLVFQKRLNRQITQLCARRAGNVLIQFRPTITALFLAAITRTPGPLLLIFIGRRMVMSEQATELGYALGQSLIYSAIVWWCASYMRYLCRSEGIAETHFDWPYQGVRLIRRKIGTLTLLGLPLAACVVFASQYPLADWSESLGRLAFMVLMILLANFWHALLGSREHVLREYVAKFPGGWVDRVRQVMHVCGILVPVLLATLAAIGYYYSAQQLALRLQMTFGLVMALVLAHSLLSRWFLVKRRLLSIQQYRQRQLLQQQQQDAPPESSEISGLAIDKVTAEQQDLAKIHDQLRMLLRHAALAVVLVGGWFIWSDVLPALKILDRVEFWRTPAEVVEITQTPEGESLHTAHTVYKVTTLRHALFAGLTLIGTYFLGSNIPALLQITILNRLPFDRGGRHAISVLTRYVVAMTGVLLAFRTMSIGWSSVQWLAAAITFGLGFGLQEIFANFVSGVILLFERPIRLGDVITLGDVTGTVTNIRIRATTVTDWDRKELIVPNKELITGRLLNWTLSDTTNRLVIQIGVAYHSDADLTRQLLLQTVQAHPNVLREPAPSALFDSFGESTLNFQIKAYLASLEVRQTTQHELNTALHRCLTEAGIEIAFPQRDINVHFVDPAAKQVLEQKKKQHAA
jgi:potassium efflux system protein